MTSDLDRLLRLLPEHVRAVDVESGEPLRQLLSVIAEQVDVVERDIWTLYDDWFVETCQDWVLPYLAELLGVTPPAGGAALLGGSPTSRRLLAALTPRRAVADAIRNRRRKGTLAVLEELAADAAGMSVAAVELGPLVGRYQAVRLLGPPAGADPPGALVDVRDPGLLDRVGTAFDTLPRTAEVRLMSGGVSVPRYGVGAVALFVWRLKDYCLELAPARCLDQRRGRYTISPLGNDMPLVRRPEREPSPTHLADEDALPGFLLRRTLQERTADVYGPGRSILVHDGEGIVPLDDVVAADLSGWAYRPTGQQVAIDPVLGRLAFSPERPAPTGGVRVTSVYAAPDDLGGGPYRRWLRQRPTQTTYTVGDGGQHPSIAAALATWRAACAGAAGTGTAGAGTAGVGTATVVICDNGVYTEPLTIELHPGEDLEIRAAQGRRPVLRLLDWHGGRPDGLRVVVPPVASDPAGPPSVTAPAAPVSDAAVPPVLTLDGLIVTGRPVVVEGALGQLTVRHSTLVPGWEAAPGCEPEDALPSLRVDSTVGCVQLDHAVLGRVEVVRVAGPCDPVAVQVADCVLDPAVERGCVLADADGGSAYASLSVQRSTVLGGVRVHELPLARDSIFTGRVQVDRRAHGCLRFCSLPSASRTPPRFRCQPDLVRAEVHSRVRRGGLPAGLLDQELAREESRVRPAFRTTQFGRPHYAVLDDGTAHEVRAGAETGSEMGAFHDLFLLLRERSMRSLLAEYVPAGIDAGIVYVT